MPKPHYVAALVKLWPDSPRSWDVGINPEVWVISTVQH